MKYRRGFDFNKEEGALSPTELDRRYDRPGKFCYMGNMAIDTSVFDPPIEARKRIRN